MTDDLLAYAAELGGRIGSAGARGTPVGVADLPPRNAAELESLVDEFAAHLDRLYDAGTPLSRERAIEFYAVVREVSKELETAQRTRTQRATQAAYVAPGRPVFGQKPTVTYREIEAARAAKKQEARPTQQAVEQDGLW